MNKKMLVDELFHKLADIIIKNVDESYHEELLNAYKDYLIKHYLKYQDDDSKYELYVNSFTELEISRWNNVNEGGKLSLLLKDSALEKIRELSTTGYQYAKAKFNSIFSNDTIQEASELEKQVIEENIKLLEELLPKVREFNKGLAANLVSEGILDYKYLLENNGITSLRIGRMYNETKYF